MKPDKLIITLIGGWILLIALDISGNRIGSRGVRLLRQPMRLAYGITRLLHIKTLFLLAGCTYLLIARAGSKYDRSYGEPPISR